MARLAGSTLFPYTTLFRSSVSRCLCGSILPRGGGAAGDADDRSAGLGHVDDDRLPGHIVRDRKSTRLNSSHVKISYAVFCLKKKNQKIHDKLNNYTAQGSN